MKYTAAPAAPASASTDAAITGALLRRGLVSTTDAPAAAPSVVELGFAVATGSSVGATAAGVAAPVARSSRGSDAPARSSGNSVGCTPVARAPPATSARCTSSIVCGRRAGSFASMSPISASSGGGIVGTSVVATGGGTSWCLAISSPNSPSNGGEPHTSSNRITPSA